MKTLITLSLVLAACSDDASTALDAAPSSDAAVDARVDAVASDSDPTFTPDVLINGLAAPFALAVSGDRRFFSDAAESVIKTCSIASCASTVTTFASGQTVARDGLRVHGDTVVWASNLAIYTCPTTGCTVPTPLHSGSLRVSGFEVGAQGDVYFADRNTKTIQRVNIAGGAPLQIVANVDDARDLWVDADGVTFTTYGSASPSLVTSKVQRCPSSGCAGSPTILSGTGEGLGAVGVAADASHVFWTDVGRVQRCPVAGCSGSPDVLFGATSSFERLLLLDGRLVWSAYSSGLHTCTAASCSGTHALFDDGVTVQALAADATHIYWVASSSPGDGRIARMPRDAD